MRVQAHVYFSGIVQGVGFRYTTHRLACDLGLVGWVKNLSDGRVEVLAQGPQQEVKKLVEQLQTHFSGSIQNTDVTFNNALEKFNDFRVI